MDGAERQVNPRTLPQDRAAFRALYERTQRTLHRAAWGITLNAAEASDVVHDAYARLLASAATLRDDTNVEAWLLRVTVNQALSWRRRLVRWGQGEDVSPVARVTPERETGAREATRHLLVAMRALPPAQRAVVTLRLESGLSPAQIAEVLGREPNAVRVTLHRGLEQLRARLKAAGVDPAGLTDEGADTT
jgi:RNA polymerase sigma factor (sigma-70 family)